ncbi:MAG: SagB/ThcOx family dehydrogenase [Acidimicrobiia bacterium]|nr:SagB/ThcOx family dehydrogenase [Acidimicrobiia bacterium]
MDLVALPPPSRAGSNSLEASLAQRRSVRHYTPEAVSLSDLSQLLWATQGISGADKHGPVRTAPSAGRTSPLEVYVVTAEGIALYGPAEHQLQPLGDKDVRQALAEAALDQGCVREAPLVLALIGRVARTVDTYGDRAERYVTLEAGHAAQNALLQATALGLGAVPVGSFDDDQVRHILGLASQATPLYLICVGHPAPK